jgi:hypothetical protein
MRGGSALEETWDSCPRRAKTSGVKESTKGEPAIGQMRAAQWF